MKAKSVRKDGKVQRMRFGGSRLESWHGKGGGRGEGSRRAVSDVARKGKRVVHQCWGGGGGGV